jgi:hypothetical protein
MARSNMLVAQRRTETPVADLTNAVWHKSSESINGDCVEVAVLAEDIAVRDSKDPEGPVLRFSPEAWKTFVRGSKDGAFDPS